MPVLPLPGAVLFPGVLLPLHLHHDPWVAMVGDVQRGAGHVVTAHPPQAAPATAGGEAHTVSVPQFAPVGCLARVVQARARADGSLDVVLEGVRRVVMVRPVAQQHRYACFQTASLPSFTPEDVHAARFASSRFANCLHQLARRAARHDRALLTLLRATRDPWALADILAAAVVQDPRQQQAVLQSKDLRERLSRVVDGLAAAMLQLAKHDPGTRH